MTVIYILKSTPCGYLIFRFNSFEVTYRIRKVTEMVEPHFLMTSGPEPNNWTVARNIVTRKDIDGVQETCWHSRMDLFVLYDGVVETLGNNFGLGVSKSMIDLAPE